MEILLNGADFSANAVTKLSDGIKEYLNGCYLATGQWSANNNYYKSSVVVEISQAMRTNGFVIQNMRNLSDSYGLVIFCSGSTPTTENVVEVIQYTTGSRTFWRVYAEQIPQSATHFVVNFAKTQNEGAIYENYLIPVVEDYGFVTGYINNSGGLVPDDSFHTTKMIPVSGGTYYMAGNYYSTYDKYGNFIARLTIDAGKVTLVTFSDDVAFVRISSTLVVPTALEY